MGRKPRKKEIVVDTTTGTIMAREAPLTQDEKLDKLGKIVKQETIVGLAETRWETAKAHATEMKAQYETEVGRMRELIRDSPQGELFPATDEDIKSAEKPADDQDPPVAAKEKV